MRRSTAIMAATAILLVAGCNRGTGNNSTNAAAPANSTNSAAAAPAAAPAPAPAAGGSVDQAFLVGHWGANGDCSRTLTFNADGTAVTSGDNEVGRWRLEGNQLVTQGPGEAPQPVPVSRRGDTLILTGPQGQQAALTRCAAAASSTPAAGAPAAGPAGADEEE